MEMDVDFTGFEDTIKAIEALPGLLGQAVYGAGMLAAAQVVAAQAKTTSAFADKTGRLRGSIKARPRASRVYTSAGRRKIPGSAAQVFAGGPGAMQAFLIEHGRQPGPGYPAAERRPFLEPALIGTRAQQFSAAVRAMKRQLGTVNEQIRSGRVSRRNLRLLSEDT